MKREELRIGNLIEYQGETHVVRELHLFTFSSSLFTLEYDVCKGIPLTPEWLEKAGATIKTETRDGSMNYWCKEQDFSVDVETILTINKLEILFYFRIHDSVNIKGSRRKAIRTLHQLQNLYFALFEKELTLNP